MLLPVCANITSTAPTKLISASGGTTQHISTFPTMAEQQGTGVGIGEEVAATGGKHKQEDNAEETKWRTRSGMLEGRCKVEPRGTIPCSAPPRCTNPSAPREISTGLPVVRAVTAAGKDMPPGKEIKMSLGHWILSASS